MTLKSTKERIANWARWARGGPTRPTGSNTAFICDRMRAAKLGELPSAQAGVERLDAADAALVEQAWKALAPKHRELLRWHHVRNANPAMICRRMGIKPRPTSIFDLELARAEAEIARVLALQVDRARNAATSPHVSIRAAA